MMNPSTIAPPQSTSETLNLEFDVWRRTTTELVSTYQYALKDGPLEDYREWRIEIEARDNTIELHVKRVWLPESEHEPPDTFEVVVVNLEELRFFHVMLGEAIRHFAPVKNHDSGDAAPAWAANTPNSQ